MIHIWSDDTSSWSTVFLHSYGVLKIAFNIQEEVLYGLVRDGHGIVYTKFGEPFWHEHYFSTDLLSDMCFVGSHGVPLLENEGLAVAAASGYGDSARTQVKIGTPSSEHERKIEESSENVNLNSEKGYDTIDMSTKLVIDQFGSGKIEMASNERKMDNKDFRVVQDPYLNSKHWQDVKYLWEQMRKNKRKICSKEDKTAFIGVVVSLIVGVFAGPLFTLICYIRRVDNDKQRRRGKPRK
ncbi:uncharacterized protein [Ptychodera flava]|uniref:uncharacterized protein n=1 Tax=Ptychodera flava TaxID=63121 RepID=UPI003969D405